jgi:branched-chain amino acid transport system permease protein
MPAKRTGPSLPLLLAVAAAIVVVLAFLPNILELFLPRFRVLYQTELLIYGMTFAIAALGFNLLLGYTGLLSFGHSAYFGAGAYTVAFIVRDLHVQSMELCILGGLLSSLVIAALFGYVCVRHTRIFFGILTLALSQVLWSLAYKFFWVTGGTDGISVPRTGLTLLGGLIDFKGSGAYQRFISAYYYYVLALFVLAVAVMWVIVHSPFGKALQAIRDNEVRAGFVGIRVRRYRWIAFIISGLFTGVAGALWVPLNGLTTPDILYWPFSGEIVFMTVLGGFRTFTGPIIGALAFNYLKVIAVGSSHYWQLVLGLVLVFLVMVLPSGIIGVFPQPPPWLSRAAASVRGFVSAFVALLLLPLVFEGVLRASVYLGAPEEAVAVVTVLGSLASLVSWFLLFVLVYLRGVAIGHRWIAVLPALAAVAAAGSAGALGLALPTVLAPLAICILCLVLGSVLRSAKPIEQGA